MRSQENKELKELGKLININKDAVEFYKSAQEKAEHPSFRRTFQDLESLHSSVIINLQNYVRNNGGEAEGDQTIRGQASQFWGELMANISSDVDETLVSHLEEAEDRCLHSIEDTMKKDDIDAPTKAALQKEFTALKKSHDYMKALKDSLKDAA